MFFELPLSLPGYRLCQEKKKEEDLGVICSNEPGNETIQQSNWSAGIRFAHALSGSDLASILKV